MTESTSNISCIICGKSCAATNDYIECPTVAIDGLSHYRKYEEGDYEFVIDDLLIMVTGDRYSIVERILETKGCVKILEVDYVVTPETLHKIKTMINFA